MKKILRFVVSIFLVTGLIWTMFSSYGLAQEIPPAPAGPPSPPVAITLTVGNAPHAGEELILKLTVTPLEDMHADISCILPAGSEPVREAGLMIAPYREDRNWNTQPPQARSMYRQAVHLWLGPMQANTPKEFTFRVIISEAGTYKFISRVEAMAKWGVKEEVFTLNIN